MGKGTVWDDEAAPATQGRGTVWDDEPPALHGRPAMPPPQRIPRDPGLLRSLLSKGEQGFFKGGSDELAGSATAALVDPSGGDVGWKQPDGTVKILKTRGDAYRSGRDAEREVLRGAEHHHHWPGEAAEVAGDIASDVVAAGSKAAAPIYQAATSALTGLMGSNAELTPDKVTGRDVASATLSTVLGGGLGYLIPKAANKAGELLKGSRLERYIASKLGKAQGEIDQQAAEQLAKVTQSARGELGNAAKTVHTAGRELEEKYLQGRMLPEEAKAYLAQLDDPAIRALDRTLIANSLKHQAEGPAKVGVKRSVLEELTENGPEHLEQLQDKIGNHPFRRTIGPRLARYGPAAAAAAAGALGLGGATGSLLAAAGGALAGGLGANRLKRAGAAVGSKVADEADTILSREGADVLERAAAKVADKAKDTFGQVGRKAVDASASGALTGAAAALSGNGTGPAIQSMARAAVSPDVRKWWYQNLQHIIEKAPELLGKYGTVLLRERQRHGPEGAFAMHEALMAEDPSYLRNTVQVHEDLGGRDGGQ